MRFTTWSILLLVSLASLNTSVLCQEAVETTETIETEGNVDTSTSDDPTSTLDSDPSASIEEEKQGESQPEETEASEPVQSGPLIDLFGPQLYSMEVLDESRGQLSAHYTNEILAGKNVIGVYFSADWCGPCRQFTPELVSFYDKMNNRRGKKDQFQIVWVSRCRDVQSYANYFAHMPWVALPPEEAMGARGQMLAEKYKVKGIPHLALIDDLGQTITIDGRNKIPQDKAGIGFPWRNPVAQLYMTLMPRSLRLMVKTQIDTLKYKVLQKIKSLIGIRKKPMAKSQ